MRESVVIDVKQKMHMQWLPAATLTVAIHVVVAATPIIIIVVEVAVVYNVALTLLLHQLMQPNNSSPLLLATNVESRGI